MKGITYFCLFILAAIFSTSVTGQIINTFAGITTAGYSGDGGPATVAKLNGPHSVATDAAGNVYVADYFNNVIRKINTAGIISTFAGTGAVGYSGDGGPATAAKLNDPIGVGVDASGNVYIADELNDRIRKVSTLGVITTVAGNGTGGYSGDGGPATAAEINWPAGVAVDALGDIYIADYVNNRIRKVDVSGIITTVAGNGTAAYSGDGGPATAAEVNQPHGICVDAVGNVYFGDTFNQRIREINTSGIINTVAGSGVAGYSGDGGPATTAKINNPVGVITDLGGDIFISDFSNSRIREVKTSGTIITLAGKGIAGYSGDGGPATAAEINFPYGVAFGGGAIYIADDQNNRVRIITNICGMVATNSYSGPKCNGGSDGSASVTATNGNLPYTYLWSGGQTSSSISGLSAGTYVCKVADSNGCTSYDTVIITQPAALGISNSFSNATCGNNNGSATATPGGGTGPYTYTWAPTGGTNATITGLSAGSYSCTVTDANGCTKTSSVTITATGAPKATSTQTNLKCFGYNNGSATANVTGGTSPYTYSWSPSGGTNATATGLSAGSYTCTVTDKNGCITYDTVIITQPAAITLSTTSNNAKCSGNDGSATATVGGGTGAYTYSWSPSGGTSATVSNLSAGTYTITVMDANGCSKTASVNISNIGAPSVSSSKTNIRCFGDNNGSATATVSGGTAPYTYSWSPSGGTNASATGLSAGTYTCTITDSKGCTVLDTVTIEEPSALAETLSETSATCGNTNGTAMITAIGGTGAYTYKWTPGGYTSASISGLSAGSYTCTVTDVNGCVVTASAVISKNGSSPIVTVCCDTIITEGTGASLNVITGSGITGYDWTPVSGLSCTGCPDPVATPTVTTTYTVVVTDSNGCTTTRTITVTVEIPCSDFIVPNVFTPNDDGINDDFVIRVENPSSYSINIYDRWGKEVYKSTDATKFWNGKYNNTDYVVPDGVYYYVIKATCGTNSYAKDGFVHLISGRK